MTKRDDGAGQSLNDGRPARRPRYRGTHPRRFTEKYKELAPDRYPEIVGHVRERGQTPAGQHVPIMVQEVIDALGVRPGMRGVDATLGWGGHAQQLLERLSPGGRLLALDADPIELPKAEARLRALGFGDECLIVRRTNFAGVQTAIAEAAWHEGVDFLFADLGVSSMQIDDPARGFSFKVDGPLDMRMNPHRGLPAAQWIVRAPVETLAAALAGSDEPHASTLAEALAGRADLTSTHALAAAVRDALASRASDEEIRMAVRRVFQALRIEVNDELGTLDALLRQLPACLRPGGRAAVLTFHSGEDRRVKKAFDEGRRAGLYVEVAQEVTRASAGEQRANPRATSAKLRWARRR
jgi:16S rRNA (cytosine1402-N4)-methyltransferase